MKYIVNEDTLAIFGCGIKKTRVVEKNRELEFSCSWREILNESCLYYGSSYQGRVDGSKYLLEKGYKIPILISDSKNLIFFPLISGNDNECIWISFQNILKYIGNKEETLVYFSEKNQLKLPISGYVFDSQFLKAYRLEKILYFVQKNPVKI